MIFLYIFIALSAVFVFLLLSKIKFEISYAGDIELKISYLFIKKRLYFSKKSEKDVDEEIEISKKPKKYDTSKPNLKFLLKTLFSLIKELYSKAKKHLRLEKYNLKINVATGDMMTTGVLYGVVSAAAASVAAFVENIENRTDKDIYTEVKPDFISEKPDVFFDIALSVRLCFGLSILYTLYKHYSEYNSHKIKANEKTEKGN